MPLIKSVEYLPINGGSLRVVCTDPTIGTNGEVTFTRQDLPGNLRNSSDLAAIETYINTRIANFLSFVDVDGLTQWRAFVKVRVLSNTGGLLVVDVMTANEPF